MTKKSRPGPLSSGGRAGIRGYIVQTLLGLLRILVSEPPFKSITLEPAHESQQFDVMWETERGLHAMQVKSTEGEFRYSDVSSWAAKLDASRKRAVEIELHLVGSCARKLNRQSKMGRVLLVKRGLDVEGFCERAAHLLDSFLRSEGLEAGSPERREMLANALLGELAVYSAAGDSLRRTELVQLIKRWIESSGLLVSSLPKLYDCGSSGTLLSREALTKDDLDKHLPIKPNNVDDIVESLMNGDSIAVQGKPGSGKSALGAWVNWLIDAKGKSMFGFRGQLLQDLPASEVFEVHLSKVPASGIVAIDDVHLVEKLMAYLRAVPWARQKTFFLLGRRGFFDWALPRGVFPAQIRVPAYTISDEQSSSVAQALVRQYLDDERAKKLLHHTGHDLVSTKWMLEAIAVGNESPDSTPVEAALRKLKTLRDDKDPELLRLFCTLASFGQLEFWCPETFLRNLNFEPQTLENLHERMYEIEVQMRSDSLRKRDFRILRHPKLCYFFLEAFQLMEMRYEQAVLQPTCSALSLPFLIGQTFSSAAVVLGAAVAKCAAALVAAENLGSEEHELKEQLRRLKFVYVAANGERRTNGCRASQRLMDDLKRRLGVRDMPSIAFAEKGSWQYQEAYLLRLDNAGEQADR